MHRFQTVSEQHVDAISALCKRQGWPSWTPERARAALTAPGVIAVVAVEEERVLGAAQLLSDGSVMAYLGMLLVAPEARGRGIGRGLVQEVMRRSGLERVDLLSTDESLAFYERFTHKRKPGVRIYA
jgi:predicted N-acetyltransferase YhbS